MTILPLTLSGVSLQVNQRALLRDVNHSFSGTSISVVLGHNGAGKTLMLKVCHGLVAPTAGRVLWNDPERARRPGVQGMVFQKPVLLRRSVRQNIEHVLRTCRVPAHEKNRRIEQALETGRLTDMADRPARRLSGGEQQRVALARAWAVRPEVLILDEPCTYLDPGAVTEVERIITAFHDSGTKIIVATHDVAQARRIAGEIVLMHGGTVAESGPAEDFFARPKTEEARAFLEGRLWTAGTQSTLAN